MESPARHPPQHHFFPPTQQSPSQTVENQRLKKYHYYYTTEISSQRVFSAIPERKTAIKRARVRCLTATRLLYFLCALPFPCIFSRASSQIHGSTSSSLPLCFSTFSHHPLSFWFLPTELYGIKQMPFDMASSKLTLGLLLAPFDLMSRLCGALVNFLFRSDCLEP